MAHPSEEQLAFHFAVYAETRRIPPGKATSYGHIARRIYRPRNARQVGMSLKNLGNYVSYFDQFNLESVPWWRVVNSQGFISKRGRSDAVERQAELLREEGVLVSFEGNEYHVDLGQFGWFPEVEEDTSDERSES